MSTVTQSEVQDVFGDVEASDSEGPQPVPNDRYHLEVTSEHIQKRESDAGNWRVGFGVRILAGEKTGDKFAGRFVFDTLFLNVTKADGSASKAQSMTKAMLEQILGEVPDEVRAISRYDQEALADAIASLIPGAIFVAEVYTEADEEFGDRNRIRLPRRSK
jgi:hypothetical protein